MKRLILMTVVLTAYVVQAKTTEWTGRGGDGEWTTGANWSVGCPAEADTALFPIQVSVKNVPTTFHGVLDVGCNGYVAMVLDDTYSFSIKISNPKGMFHRYGTGEVTLRPVGLSEVGGKIVLNSGSVTVFKPAVDGLGAFPNVEVNGWAKMYVAESPTTALPTAYVPGSQTLFLCEKNTIITQYGVKCLAGGSVSVSVDGTTVGTVSEGASQTFEKSYTPGWHVLSTTFSADNGLVDLSRSKMSERDDGVFSADILWQGVAIHDLNLMENAHLYLGEDQAVAIGTASSSSCLAGVVHGGSGCRLALLGGSICRVGLNGLAQDFHGTIEVGRIMDVSLENVSLTDCRIVGKGTVHVSSGCESLFGAGFSGCIDIPAGVSFVAPSSLRGFAATGTGSLVLTHPEQIGAEAGFAGKVTLPDNVSVHSDKLAAQAESVLLGNGDVCLIGERAITYASGAYDALDGLGVAGAWTLLGSGDASLELKDGSTVTFSNTRSYVDGTGALVLTDGPNQHHAAMLKSRAFGKTDDWSCEFDWSATMPEDSVYVRAGNGQTLAEGTAFILQPSFETYHTYSVTAAPLGSYGFFISVYNTKAGIRWVDNGFINSQPNVPDGVEGITVTEPIHFLVRCRDGIMFVRMSQDGKTYEFSRNVAAVFGMGKQVYLGFSAATSWWGSSAVVPWALQTVSGFSGRVAKPDVMTVMDSDLGNLKNSQWTTSGNTYRDGNGGVVRLMSTASKTGFLLNKVPFPAHRPFTLQFTATCSEFYGIGAEGFSCAFQQQGTGVTHPGGSAYYLKDIPSCGFACNIYMRAIGWIQDGAVVDRVDNAVDLTSGLPSVYTLVYDGAGGMTLSVTSENKSFVSHRYYPELNDWGENMYMTFVGATASWTHCKVGLSNMSVTRPQTGGKTVSIPVTLGAKDHANATVQTEFADISAVFDSVKVSEGATLTFGATQGDADYVVSNVWVGGESVISTSGSSLLSVGTSVIYECPEVCALHCVGNLSFPDALTIIGRSTWLGSADSGIILDYIGLSSGSVRPNSYAVIDENGEDLRRFSLSAKESGVTVMPKGLTIVIR